MIKRKISKYLESFFKESKNALLITGARQVGKTYSIRRYGESHYKCFVELNFAENRDAIEAFSNASNTEDLMMRISLLANKPLIKGNTLIFLDEIQECPDAVTAIKFLVEDGQYRFVLSGSLLGVDLQDIRSLPVGYLSIKQMFPLDLEEFFISVGVQEDVIEQVRQSWESCVPLNDFIHKTLMRLFRLYLIVGGMPAVVKTYIESNDLIKVMRVQNDIVELNKKDISKYDPQHKLYIEEIYNLIAPELNSKNKRFVLKSLNENTKFKRIENSFLWLKEAGVALPVYNVEEPTTPLLLARSRNLFKLFMADVGLLACQYAGNTQMKILNDDDNINFGAIYENFVAQELKAHGFSLFYYNSKRQGEIDFVVEIDDNVLPIEVKSGKDYSRHRALSNIMTNDQYGLQQAYVLCNDNIRRDANITYAPIYMTMFIKQHDSDKLIYRVPLDNLNIH